MKKLSEYVNNESLDLFDEQILSHIAIEYKHYNNYSRNHLILEKYGVYDGCAELSDIILKDVEQKYENGERSFQLSYNKNDFKDLKNIFFKKLTLDFELGSDDIGGEYFDNDSIDKTTMLFDEVFIEFIAYNTNDIRSMLMHELTHAYNNYNMLVKDNMKFYDKANSQLYLNITNSDIFKNSGELKKNIIKILYFTVKEERNAFIAQMAEELKRNKAKVNNPKDAFNILKNSPIYMTYKNLYEFVHSFDNTRNTNDKESMDIITQAYNDLCGTKMTPDKVMKKLKFLMDKAMKKFDTIVAKLCVENLNNVTTMAPTKLFL